MVKTERSPVSKIILVIVFIILVPTFTYTLYEISRMNKSELIIKEIYDRQLDAILYSVEQDCWDQTAALAWEIKDKLRYLDEKQFQTDEVKTKLLPFIQSKEAVEAILLIHLNKGIVVIQDQEKDLSKQIFSFNKADFSDQQKSKFAQLIKLASKGYNKINPIPLPDNGQPSPVTLLTFSLQEVLDNRHTGWICGMVMNTAYVGEEIVANKLKTIESEDFIFAVQKKPEEQLLYVSGDTTSVSFEREKTIHLYPNLQLLVRLKGQSIAELAHNRSQTNLIFLLTINIVLIIGALVLFKIVSSEIQLAKMKSDFVSNVSHELRTPLALIRMFAETLELGRVPNEDRKMHYYRTISNEANRLTRMINNILDFSRIEAGRKSFKTEWTNVPELVREVLDSYRFHLEQQGFELHEKIIEDLPAVQLDPEAVSQAFINLLENAAKYSKGEKWIEVELTSVDSQIILTVRDHGIGIDKTYHDKIFEKFYRVSDSLVHDTKGSGLGLSLVKYIMAYHQGDIRVESSPGKGSAFSLVFPISTN